MTDISTDRELIERLKARLHRHPGQISVDRDLINDVRQAADRIAALLDRVAELEAELAKARRRHRGIMPEYPPDYPGGFDGPTGAE